MSSHAQNFAHDDMIGHGGGSLARVRVAGSDTIKVPIMGKHHQHGFVQVTLRFERNSMLQAPQMPAPSAPYPQQVHYAAPAPAYNPPQPQYYAPATQPAVYYAPAPQPAVVYAPAQPSVVYVDSGCTHHSNTGALLAGGLVGGLLAGAVLGRHHHHHGHHHHRW